MKKKPLKERLANYFKQRHTDFISGGELERIVIKFNLPYKPSTLSRRLRELSEVGTLERKMMKGTVFYRYQPTLTDIWNATSV